MVDRILHFFKGTVQRVVERFSRKPDRFIGYLRQQEVVDACLFQ